VGEVAHLPFGSAAEGTVLAQDPPPHAQGIQQPSVSLLVAAPDDETPDGYVMPDLTGLPFTSAEAALNKVGIKAAPPSYVSEAVPPVGSGDTPIKLPVKPGDVVAQSPSAGTRVDQTTLVKLTVAR
jgi:beta-lactam-binding protein with PASTA domain